MGCNIKYYNVRSQSLHYIYHAAASMVQFGAITAKPCANAESHDLSKLIRCEL